MKRTDITELFPEATDEQVKTLMDINGNDINAAKRGAEELRGQLQSLQGEIAALKAGAPADELTKAKAQAESYKKELDAMKAAESIRAIREKVAGEKNVPIGLLTGDTEEACAQQADNILAFAQKPNYPAVRDGGETGPAGKADARQQFVDWFNQVSNR